MNTHETMSTVGEPLTEQPRVSTQATVEVPQDIYELAEKRAAAGDGDLDEYLLDHLMIEFDFVQATE